MRTPIIDVAASAANQTGDRGPVELVEWSGDTPGAFASQHARAVVRSRMDGRSAPTLMALDAVKDGILKAYESQPDAKARVDSVYAGRTQPLASGARFDAAEVDRMRRDNLSASSGLLFARDLEYIHARVLEEKVANLNALALFGVASRVPVGATSHTVRRFGDAGEARMYRAGEDIPTVSLAAVEESFGIAHMVVQMKIDFFEALAHGFVGLNEYERKLRAMRRAIDRLLNRLAWWGSDQFDLHGILNYPHLPKRVYSTSITAPATAADFDALLAAFNSIINRARYAHKDIADPTRLVTSTRLRDFLNQTRHPEGRESLAELIIRDQPLINAIEGVWELQGEGPGSTDIMILWDDRDPDARPTFELVQPFALLPLQNNGLEQKQIGYATAGGMVMHDVRAASLTYFTIGF